MFIEAKATVPADGATEVIDVAGVSVKVIGVGSYEDIESRPQFSFDTAGAERQRIFEGGVYQNDKGKFNQLILHGSATAENDVLYFYVTPACLEPNIDALSSSDRIVTFTDQAEETIAGTATFSFSSLSLANSEGMLPTAVYIGARNFDLLYSKTSTPSGTMGFVLTAGADPIKIEGGNLIQDLVFANLATGGGSDGTLTYFFEY